MSTIMNGIEQQSLFADTSLTMNVIVGQDNRYRTGKLVGIGKKIRKKLTRKLEECSEEINRIFTKIRLYTRGKKEDAIALKKKLSEEMQRQVSRLQRLVEKNVDGLSGTASEQYRQALEYYRLMLSQIRHWMRTGFHRPGKYLSLWEKNARAITRNKAGKMVEFGRRWFITRLAGGYIIGAPCKKLGSDADTGIVPEIEAFLVLIVFMPLPPPPSSSIPLH